MAEVSLSLVKELALQAGEIALARFLHVQPSLKPGDELVTRADREIEAFLVSRLREAYPEHGILGEELGISVEGKECLWALDPIDGTRAFASGLPVWGISIGLLERGRPTRGVFYMPLLRECYYVDAQGEAFWNDRPLARLSGDSWNVNALLCVPSDAHRRYDIRFSGVTRAMGSTAANIIYVARGTAVGALIGRPHLWDIAVALAILERVGGLVCYLSGKPVELSLLLDGRKAPEPMLAAPPDLLQPLLKEIKVR